MQSQITMMIMILKAFLDPKKKHEINQDFVLNSLLRMLYLAVKEVILVFSRKGIKPSHSLSYLSSQRYLIQLHKIF